MQRRGQDKGKRCRWGDLIKISVDNILMGTLLTLQKDLYARFLGHVVGDLFIPRGRKEINNVLFAFVR